MQLIIPNYQLLSSRFSEIFPQVLTLKKKKTNGIFKSTSQFVQGIEICSRYKSIVREIDFFFLSWKRINRQIYTSGHCITRTKRNTPRSYIIDKGYV